MKKTKNLIEITDSMLKNGQPELKKTLEGLSPIYAKIIYARRLDYGYSRQQLAKKANTGITTISRAEGGFDHLSSETYDQIFRALNLQEEDIAEAILQLLNK